MSDQFEALFKNLANGMSRRAALRRFFGGIAGAAAFALTGRRVRADDPGVCARWCREEHGDDGPAAVAACINLSQDCEPGHCARIFNVRWGGDKDGPNPGRPGAEGFACVDISV